MYKKQMELFDAVNIKVQMLKQTDKYKMELNIQTGINTLSTKNNYTKLETETKNHLAFICHTSEDKERYAKPLYESIVKTGNNAWFDEAEIKWGDSIVDKINEGLSKSEYVIVLLSDNFLGKNWAEKELNSALSMEISEKNKKVLPLRVGSVSLEKYPLLSAKKYENWTTPDEIAKKLLNLSRGN